MYRTLTKSRPTTRLTGYRRPEHKANAKKHEDEDVRAVPVTEQFYSIESVRDEMDRTQQVLHNVLTRFKSEANTNTLDLAGSQLRVYCHVPNEYNLNPGRFVRYIDQKDAYGMVLKPGGFVVSDNGFTVTLKSDELLFRVVKKRCLWFMYMYMEDELKHRLEQFI